VLVVSDTSPIRGLSTIDRLDLLPSIYGSVLVPPPVAQELSVPVEGLPPLNLLTLPFLIVHAPADRARVDEFRRRLGACEAEALALALETRAEAVLIAENRGRVAAHRLGLRPIGLLALLVEAKQQGLVAAVGPLVKLLIERIDFRADPRLIATILRMAGETESTQ